MRAKLYSENLRERDKLRDIRLDGDGTGINEIFMWLRIESSGGGLVKNRRFS
jgi:hypothetical protein